jgi:hypothetical protein
MADYLTLSRIGKVAESFASRYYRREPIDGRLIRDTARIRRRANYRPIRKKDDLVIGEVYTLVVYPELTIRGADNPWTFRGIVTNITSAWVTVSETASMTREVYGGMYVIPSRYFADNRVYGRNANNGE